MPFGFFSRLHYRTRDSILEGALEAGHILENGPDGNTVRTDTIEEIDADGTASLPKLSAASNGASSGQDNASKRSRNKKSSGTASSSSQGRTARRTAKTEAMFNVDDDPQS